MQQPQRRINIEAEKKKNVGIAISLAAAGIVLGIILYIGMFVVMFAFPFAFFSIMPFPSEYRELVSVDGRLVLFTEKLDFDGALFQNEPKEKTFMSEFDGKGFSGDIEVEPFSTVSAHDGKLYFFSEGQYSIYDFEEWQVFENAAIGNTPKGVVSPEGVWVLSDLLERPALVLLREGLALDVPLPLTEEDEANVWLCSSKLIWSGGELHLFWKIGGSLLHEIYDGQSWRAAGYFEDPGEYDVIGHGGDLTLFSHVMGQEFKMWTYDGGVWASQDLGAIKKDALNIGFEAAEYEGKVVLLVNNFFSTPRLYELEDSNISKTNYLGSMMGNLFVGWMLIYSLVFYLVVGLIVFIVSLIINRVKLTYWLLKRGRVRFASIFRRFAAYTIDTFITMLPIAPFSYMLLDEGFSIDNPLRYIGSAFLLMGGLILLKYLYFSLFEGLWGRTPGKWICGIMVLRDNFTKCTLGRGFLRNLLRVVDAMFYYFVALITIGATLKWQRLGDLAAGTVVVRARRRKKKVSAPTTPTPIASGQEHP